MTTTDTDPKCDICGVEVTTGMMAAYCPKREGCEMWPKDATPAEVRFLDWIGGRIDSPDEPVGRRLEPSVMQRPIAQQPRSEDA